MDVVPAVDNTTMIKILTILILTLLLIYSCEDIRSYPPEPEITYVTHHISDTIEPSLGNLVKYLYIEIKFADGDGDLTYYRDDNNDTTTNSKIALAFYEKINGEYNGTPVVNSLTNIPYGSVMDRTGQNKTITGKIKFVYLLTPWQYDTVRLDVYIIDKAYHKSNVIEIPGDIAAKN